MSDSTPDCYLCPWSHPRPPTCCPPTPRSSHQDDSNFEACAGTPTPPPSLLHTEYRIVFATDLAGQLAKPACCQQSREPLLRSGWRVARCWRPLQTSGSARRSAATPVERGSCSPFLAHARDDRLLQSTPPAGQLPDRPRGISISHCIARAPGSHQQRAAPHRPRTRRSRRPSNPCSSSRRHRWHRLWGTMVCECPAAAAAGPSESS